MTGSIDPPKLVKHVAFAFGGSKTCFACAGEMTTNEERKKGKREMRSVEQ